MKSTTGYRGEDLGPLPVVSRPIWSLTRWPLFLLLTIGGMAFTVLSVSHAQVQAVEALAENTELSADKESGEVDYWADVTFGKFHFREVLEQVRNHYIDKDYDKVWDKVDPLRPHTITAAPRVRLRRLSRTFMKLM